MIYVETQYGKKPRPNDNLYTYYSRENYNSQSHAYNHPLLSYTQHSAILCLTHTHLTSMGMFVYITSLKQLDKLIIKDPPITQTVH